MNRLQCLVSTSLLGLAVSAQPAFAQDSETEEANAAQNEGQGVPDVVVTAERRFSTAQRTAASVSVRPGNEMLLQGRYELKNILEDVPGVVGGAAATVSTSQGSGTDNPASGLTIRGIQSNSGSGGTATSTSAAAAIYVDDVYNGIGGAYDIERVEVLRGPQGTLYGRSATAGVVAIQTGTPDTADIAANGAVEFGNFGLVHVTGAVNIPIIEDQLALRVSGNHFERDGYYATQGDARESTEFRAKLLWTPTDNFSALVGYAHQDNTTFTGGLSISQGSSPTDFVYMPGPVGNGVNQFRQIWANFNVDLGPVAITYIPAYRTWYQNANNVIRSNVFNADQTIITDPDTFQTHELRIRNTDSDSPLQWQVGAMYYQNKLSERNELFNVDLNVFAFKSDTSKRTTAEGVFAEATYSFSPETRLTAGIRYDRTNIVVDQEYTSIIGLTATLTGADRLAEFNNVNYKVRLEHNLSPQSMVYASIATGFSPGDKALTQDNTFTPVTQILDAETLTAFEIGSKNRFLDNHLQVNGAVYYYDYSGYQTAGVNTGNPATPTFRTISVPVTSYGAELEVLARPWEGGTFNISASYTNARYGDFAPADAPFYSSNKVAPIAPVKASASYDHRFEFGDGTALSLRAAVRFVSEHDSSRLTDQQAGQLPLVPPFIAAPGAQPYIRVPSEFVGDLGATLLLGETLSITGYVRNVTDNRFLPDGWNVAAVIPSPVQGGPPFVVVDSRGLSDPRTFGVILGLQF